MTAKTCAICGKVLLLRRGEGPARYARRVCCSRRCALKRGHTERSIMAREALQRALAVVPRQVVNGSIQQTQQWLQAHAEATKALHRRAGYHLCTSWLRELADAAREASA